MRFKVWMVDERGVNWALHQMLWSDMARLLEEQGDQVGRPVCFAEDPQGRLVLYPRPEE